MKAIVSAGPENGLTRDYAVIETEGAHVMVEANEWDTRLSGYHVVTLWLSPLEAERMATDLLQSVIALRTQSTPEDPL